jgi:N-acetylmuramoyl-L-alanine amidase
VNQLAPANPARTGRGVSVVHGTGLFLDPGLHQNRQLIIDGVVELITRYNVDGVHLDDYFYPARDFNDAQTFALFGSGMDLDDWRRENVNALVRGIRQAIRETRPNVRFGISPVGVWANQQNNPLGSDTNGYEGFSAIFGDSRRWVTEGWVDYICPQIYWRIGHNAACYSTLIHWWNEVAEGTGVDLYIGMAAYKEVDESDTSFLAGETVRQLGYNRQFNNVSGHIFFRAGHITGRLGDQISEFYRNQSGFDSVYTPITSDTLTVVQPAQNAEVTGAAGFYFYGAADPSRPVFANGKLVENRTAEGFWSFYYSLPTGVTTVTISQDGQQPVTRTVTNRRPAPTPTPRPPARINEVAADNPLYAVVMYNAVWAYPGHTTTGGSHWKLLPGQTDKVTAITEDGGWLRLGCGAWVEAGGVHMVYKPALVTNVLSNGTYNFDWPDLHSITWQASEIPAVYVTYENHALTIRFGMHTAVPETEFSGIISSVERGIEGSTPFYRLTIAPEVNFEGYWIDFSDGILRLNLKMRKTLHPSEHPLHGFVFLLDAGHGGNDHGARGALGNVLSEKYLNLAITKKLAANLEALGAQVYLTRHYDAAVPLSWRVELSRFFKPDMFISIHCNSVAETTDSTNIRGLTMWYRGQSAHSRDAAEIFMRHLHAVNPYTTRNPVVSTANHYVNRPSWAPSVIIESSFINNIHDFSWLINPVNQEALAAAIAEAVLEYFSQ